MKSWLLDADVIIDFLTLDIFDSLIKNRKVYVVSTVVDKEVKFFRKVGKKVPINFRKEYIDNCKVIELSATAADLEKIVSNLPSFRKDSIDAGELESLAVLDNHPELTFCTCDAATIRVLSILDLSDRAISVEKLLNMSGLTAKSLYDKHREKYFRNNLQSGREDKIYYM